MVRLQSQRLRRELNNHELNTTTRLDHELNYTGTASSESVEAKDERGTFENKSGGASEVHRVEVLKT